MFRIVNKNDGTIVEEFLTKDRAADIAENMSFDEGIDFIVVDEAGETVYTTDASEYDDERDPFLSDAEADADALASVGWGTDEDYGDFGGDCDY